MMSSFGLIIAGAHPGCVAGGVITKIFERNITLGAESQGPQAPARNRSI